MSLYQPYTVDIVDFYSVRYLLGLHFISFGDEVRQLEAQNERDINDVWWELGLYEKRGHDYYGQTYRTVPDEYGDTTFTGNGAQNERENETVYSER